MCVNRHFKLFCQHDVSVHSQGERCDVSWDCQVAASHVAFQNIGSYVITHVFINAENRRDVVSKLVQNARTSQMIAFVIVRASLK